MRNTKSLSQESVKYVSSLRRNGGKDTKKTSQLWREIVDVLSDAINNSSSDLAITSMKTTDEAAVTVSIQSCYAGRRDITLSIDIDLQGQSKIIAQAPETSVISMSFAKFQKSAAFKRYFYLETTEGTTLTANIPSRQITSRYLTDYLIHILDQLQPFFMAMSNVGRMTQAA